MVPELTPAHNRAAISGVATAFNWSVAFVVTFFFEPLQESIRPYGAYLVFMSFMVIGVAMLLGEHFFNKLKNFKFKLKNLKVLNF